MKNKLLVIVMVIGLSVLGVMGHELGKTKKFSDVSMVYAEGEESGESSESSSGYSDDQIAAAKAWLSAHGYSPTRAGANAAYNDYINGKFDNDPEVQAALGNTVASTQAPASATTEEIRIYVDTGAEKEETTESGSRLTGENGEKNTAIEKGSEDTTEAGDNSEEVDTDDKNSVTDADDEVVDTVIMLASDNISETATDAEPLSPEEIEKKSNTVLYVVIALAIIFIIVVAIVEVRIIKGKDDEED